MKRNPIASSNIKSVGYADGEMHIEFANGRVYAYIGPKVKEHYDALISAPSAGKYFSANVRSCPDTQCRSIAP